jgi:hypothetical protein
MDADKAPKPVQAHRQSRASADRTSETGSVIEAPPAFAADAFNDIESGGAGPGASNKTGMLGYNYNRKTRINWCVVCRGLDFTCLRVWR